jgi:hypothetical protein
MSPAVAALTIAIAFGALVLVIVLVRRGKLKERFAITWIVIAVGMVLLAVFRPLLDRLSDALGIQSGTTTVFLIAVLVILGVQLQLSVSVSRLEEKLRDLAEAVALGSAGRPAAPVEDADEGKDHTQVAGEDAVDE